MIFSLCRSRSSSEKIALPAYFCQLLTRALGSRKLFILITWEVRKKEKGNNMSVQMIPQPNRIKSYHQSFRINPQTAICYPGTSYAGEFLCDLLRLEQKETGEIKLVIDDAIRHEEGYFLKISDDGIVIRAKTDKGLFYGAQSLRQLLPEIGRASCRERV